MSRLAPPPPKYRTIEEIEILAVSADRRGSKGRRREDSDAWRAKKKKATDDAMLAVVAHGLLNSVTILQGTADMISGSLDERSSEEVRTGLDRIQRHAALLGGVLQDLMRGLPHEAIMALDELSYASTACKTESGMSKLL